MIYRFGVFEFDADSGELRKSGRAVALEPQPSKALSLLLAKGGDIVSREELRDAVWGQGTHVDFDRGLAYCLSQIRAALGDSGDNPRFVQTIPKRGYKFIAPLTTDKPQAASLKPQAASPRLFIPAGVGFVVAAAAVVALFFWTLRSDNAGVTVIAVSIFDNETGSPEYDRPVAGLGDLVVERLTKLDPMRLSVIGNAAVLRQPRNIRNLKAIADNVQADYVLLGQLQKGETGLRFITHFIRLKDNVHLKANRLPVTDPSLAGLETAVVEEFERATREHVLNRPSN
ncbi:MAG: winged helix-turn-helix domain-containing protein [Acidobacteriota bacterium]